MVRLTLIQTDKSGVYSKPYHTYDVLFITTITLLTYDTESLRPKELIAQTVTNTNINH